MKLKSIGVFIFPLILMPCLSADAHERKETFSPDKSVKIIQDCNSKNICNIYGYDNKTKKTTNISIDNPINPMINWINSSTAKIYFGCGNYCNTTVFFGEEVGVSLAYDLVLAVDEKNLRLAVGHKQQIEILKISNKETSPSCVIKRDWSPALALALGSIIQDAEFEKDGSFHFAYSFSKEFVPTEERIEILKSGECPSELKNNLRKD